MPPLRDRGGGRHPVAHLDVHLPPDRRRLAPLTPAGSRYLRGVDTATVTQEWAGYRPCTADGMPVVGAVPRRPGLYVGTGHAMMGMTLGPASGRLIAEAIYEQAPALDSPLLAAARY